MQTDSYPIEHQVIFGRDRECQQLIDSLERAVASQGGLLLISGEAGIGKTTLIQELGHHANNYGYLTLTGGCYDLTTTPPYAPWIEITRNYPTTDDSLPRLPEQLGEAGGMAGISSQSALFELAHDFFTEVSVQRPLMLVLEDLHWSDVASLELLRYLGRTLRQSTILIVMTYRHEEITRDHLLYPLLPLIVRESRAQRMHLSHLSHDAVEELIKSGYALRDTDAHRLVTYVWQHSEGNPFFAGELLQGLEAEQVLRPAVDGWDLGDLDDVQLPPLLLQVLDSRLERLSQETRQTLQVAAVIGQDVPLDLWQKLAQLDNTDLDQIIVKAVEARLLEQSARGAGLRFRHALLREALYASLVISRRRALHRQVAEILVERGSPDPDAVAHHFQQAGDERAVDWLIQAGERAIRFYVWKIAIARFGTALELLEASGTDLAKQGWLHFRIGRLRRFADPQQGVRHLEMAERLATAAGERVLAAFALSDRGMIRCFSGAYRRGLDEMLAGDQALEALEVDGVEVDDAVLTWVADALPAHASLKGERGSVWSWGINIRRGELAGVLAQAGRFQEALALAEPYAERVAQLTDGDPVLLASLGDVHYALGHVHTAFGRPVEAREAWSRFRAAKAGADHYRLLGFSAFYELSRMVLPYQTTRLDERERLATIAQENLQRGHTVIYDPERAGQHPWQLALLLLEGRWDTAQEVATVGLESPTSDRWAAMVAAGKLARHRGYPDRGWQQVRAMFPAGPETEPGDCTILGALDLQRVAAELALDSGDHEAAAAWIATNHRWLEWCGAVLGRAELALLRARYYLLDGDPQTARRHAEQALAHASDPEQPLAILASHRFLGHLDTIDGRLTEAEEHLQAALDLADACAAPFEGALSLLELARLRIAQHRSDDARTLLDEVRAICEPLKAQPTLDQVAALEAELVEQPVAIPFGLTPREFDVLRLVAEGLTDPEVAERLFVSPRTVSSHLTSIYTKLGVSSRAAATRLAVEHRLL